MDTLTTFDVLEVCSPLHKLSFYCSKCIQLFCGDCRERAHSLTEALKAHDVESVQDLLANEKHKMDELMEQLNHISNYAESAAAQKEAFDTKLSETLMKFIAQVEQIVMRERSTREAQLLRQLLRQSAALITPDVSARRSEDQTKNPFDELASQIAKNAALEKQFKKIRDAMQNADEANNLPNVVEAIYQSAISLKGQENVES